MRTLIVVLLLTTTAPAADRYYSRFEWGTATTGPRAAEVIMEPTDWELVVVLDGAQSMTVQRLRASLQGSSLASPLLNFSTAGEFGVTVPVQLDLNPVTNTKWESAPFPFVPSGTVSGDYQSIDFRNQFKLELPNEHVEVLLPTSQAALRDAKFALDYSYYPTEITGDIRVAFDFFLRPEEPFELEPGVTYDGVHWRSRGAGVSPAGIRLTRTPTGDATNDGAVQFDDFVILAEYFGTDGIDWEQGDFDGDGQVQFPDFVLLANNFGTTPGSASSVPEPMALLLLLVGTAFRISAVRRLAKEKVET